MVTPNLVDKVMEELSGNFILQNWLMKYDELKLLLFVM